MYRVTSYVIPIHVAMVATPEQAPVAIAKEQDVLKYVAQITKGWSAPIPNLQADVRQRVAAGEHYSGFCPVIAPSGTVTIFHLAIDWTA